MYSSRSANKSFPFLWIIVAAIVYLFTTSCTNSLRNPVRSVQICNSMELRFHMHSEEKQCEKICSKNHSNLWRRNPLASVKKDLDFTTSTCCCLFEEPWPKFIEPKLIGSEYLSGRGFPLECKPLAFGVNLSHHTRESYKTICKILKQGTPATMLDLLDYAEAAAHLNYMKPKHPSILRTIKLKQVSKVDHETAETMRKIIYQHFLDSEKPIYEYGGTNLDASKLDNLSYQINFHLKNALRSTVVGNAFDEYIISYSVMDIMAAQATVHRMNSKELHVPLELINNEYDSYDKSTMYKYFILPQIDCTELHQSNTRLTNYLNGLKKTLSSLTLKLVYENLIRYYDLLQYLENSKKVYQELKQVNCLKRQH